METRHATQVAHWRTKPERLAAENVRLKKRVTELKGQLVAAKEKIPTLSKLCLGISSEKKEPAEPQGREETEHAEDIKRRPRGHRPGSKGHGRRDYSDLETVEEIHDVEVMCSCT
ncbi:MAG: hypothetical protein ACYDEY_14235 [Acidimicrobiales bacterium]